METPSSAKPLIYQSTPTFATNALKVPLKERIKKNLPKIILGVLVIAVAIEAIVAVQTLFRPGPKQVDATSIIGVGKIVLDAPKVTFAAGETISVTVRIVTNGRSTDSTDLILKYDPAVLQTSPNEIEEGRIYQDYVIKEVNAQKGEIQISAVTPPNSEGFVGVGTFATINFTARKDGNTKLEVDFSKGSTTDSNMVETGVAIDILDQVFNLDLAIGNAEAISTPIVESCGGYYQYCHNLVGQTGRQYCTQGRKIENMCTFDPKLTTECGICKLGF